MKKGFSYFLFLLVIAFTTPSHAGEHRPLCEKVNEAQLVFEMHFEVKSTYPASNLKKGWGPPENELFKTLSTGKVTQVFKGKIKPGDRWVQAYGLLFNQGSNVKKWQKLFKTKDFSVIVFLKKKGESYRSTGWAEETAGCPSSKHSSWCEGYEEYKKKVRECIK